MRAMKDSGIPWIGEIPKDWSNAKYRYSGEFVKGKLPSEQNVEQLGKPIIGASEMLCKDCRNFSTDESVPTCQKKDILILWDGANAGIVANNCEGIVSSTAVKYVCTDKKFDAQYLFYLFKNGEPFFRSKVNGTTIPHMNQKYIDEYLCIQPLLSEQQRIAEFLDRKCAEVDEMIALQEQIIEELKAYKQSVITEAVTKGLNPDAPMRDSGIEWIGSIPEHWEVKRGKFMFQILSGAPFESELFTNDSNYMPLIRIRDIMHEDTEAYYMGAYTQEYIVSKGDILVGMDGDFNVASWKGKNALLNQRVCKLYNFKSDIHPRFIYYTLPLLLKRKNDLTYATTVKHLSTFDILAFPFTIPPITEQQAIADYLDEKCADIDSLIQTKQSKIDSLKEYKKSIIYEYVTGKREVE